MIGKLKAFESGGRIIKDVIVADARMKIANLYGCPKESYSNFHSNGVVGPAVQHELGVLDGAFAAVLPCQGDDESLLVVDPTEVVIVGREGKL